MPSFRLRCSECGTEAAEDPALLVCPECTALQEPGGVTRGVLEVVLDDLPARWPEGAASSPAFLSAFWPVADVRHLPPLAVGGTPLLPVPGLRHELGMPDLWVKDDSRCPSGSTKDRASLLVVAKALEYGFDTIATASTGNAATALAAVAAAAGTRAVVLVPAAAPRAKLVQMLAYGARVVPIEGSYDDAFELCLTCCERFGWYNRSTALNPFTTEGKKTAALEIARDLSPAEADVVLVPTGDGVILSGLAKGFADLAAAGLVTQPPRLIAVQPEGSDAIATALRTGSSTIEPVPSAASVADSLVVQAPRNAIMCLQRVRGSGGTGVLVSDEQILAAIADLARLTGVFAEPAAAASLPGLRTALEEGLVDRRERVVLLVTGTGLKDVDAALRAVELPRPVPPDADSVASAVGDGGGA
jgi:threonine synthase